MSGLEDLCMVMVQKSSPTRSEVRRDFRQHLAALQRNLEPQVFLPSFKRGLRLLSDRSWNVESANMAYDKRDLKDHCI